MINLSVLWERKFIQTSQLVIDANINTLSNFKEQQYPMKFYPAGTMYNYWEKRFIDDSLKQIGNKEMLDFISRLCATIDNSQYKSFLREKIINSAFDALRDPYTSLFNLEDYSKLRKEAIERINAAVEAVKVKPIVFLLSRVGFIGLKDAPDGFKRYNKVTHFFNYLVFDGVIEPYGYISNNADLEEQKKQIALALDSRNKEEAYRIIGTIKRKNIQSLFTKVVEISW